jgi:hypothetical protein
MARIQETVVLEAAAITQSGTIDDVTVVAGHPMLIDNAVDAVDSGITSRQSQTAGRRGHPLSIRVNFKLEFQ